MGAFQQGISIGYGAARRGPEQAQAHDDALLETQAAPIVDKLRDPETTPEDANTLRSQLIQMYGRGQGHKAIAKLNDIYGVTAQPTAVQGSTGDVPAASLPSGGTMTGVDADGNPTAPTPTMPGATSIPGQQGQNVDARPKTVNEILASHPNAPLTPEEVKRAARIHAGLEPREVAEKPAKPISPKDVTRMTGPDGKEHSFVIQDGKYVEVEGASGFTPVAPPAKPIAGPKVGTFGDFMLAGYGAHPTAQQYAEGRKKWAQAVASSTSGTHEVAVAQPDGTIKMVTVGSTSKKTIGDSGSGDLPASRQDMPGASDAPLAATPLSRRPARATRGSGAAASGDGTPGRVVGGKRTPDQVKNMESADVAETAYNTAVERAKNPTPLGDTGLVLAWAKTQILGGGRLNNQEIERGIKSGSFDTRISNAYERATSGKLDGTFRKQMVDDLGITAKQMRAQADKSLAPKSAKALKDGAPKTQDSTSKGKRSLAAAMALPINKGKTKDEVRTDLAKHGYEAVE